MDNIAFRIITNNNDVYYVSNSGSISSKASTSFTESWKLKGLENVKSNEFIPFVSITKDKISQLTLLYKNGNPRYTVRDLDHGTTRVWGNTKYHGIKQIIFEN